MTLATVQISAVQIIDATHMSAQMDVITTWGHTLSDVVTADLSSLTAAQVLAGIKTKVINWAATVQGGSQVITSSNVWVFGAPQ